MTNTLQRIRGLGWIAGLAIFLGASSLQAAIINLSAYIINPLYQQDGFTPLADGSLVQIIGSYDNVIDPMSEVGGGLTGSPTGDDVILATIVIDSTTLGIDGTFYVSNIYYNNDDIKHMYIRFYDTTGPLTGLVYWGESPIQNVEYDAFGAIFVDFVGGYSTTNQDNFVVIPEPNTMNYFLMWASMLGALRSSMRREARKKTKERMKGILEPQEHFPMNTYDRF
ncbi:MAG TPA: hypothetical protein PKE12_06270 [Kiritimatiellia bacterium]|nr:hypothetical protein [Kiritimatiellia bacterium]